MDFEKYEMKTDQPAQPREPRFQRFKWRNLSPEHEKEICTIEEDAWKTFKQEHIQYRKDLVEYNKQMTEFNNRQKELGCQFKIDAIAECGLTDHPNIEEIWEAAQSKSWWHEEDDWEDYDNGDIYGNLKKLAELVVLPTKEVALSEKGQNHG